MWGLTELCTLIESRISDTRSRPWIGGSNTFGIFIYKYIYMCVCVYTLWWHIRRYPLANTALCADGLTDVTLMLTRRFSLLVEQYFSSSPSASSARKAGLLWKRGSSHSAFGSLSLIIFLMVFGRLHCRVSHFTIMSTAHYLLVASNVE